MVEQAEVPMASPRTNVDLAQLGGRFGHTINSRSESFCQPAQHTPYGAQTNLSYTAPRLWFQARPLLNP